MIDYRDIWNEAYYDARDDGKGKEEAVLRAYEVAQDWTDRQMAKAEAMEDR